MKHAKTQQKKRVQPNWNYFSFSFLTWAQLEQKNLFILWNAFFEYPTFDF